MPVKQAAVDFLDSWLKYRAHQTAGFCVTVQAGNDIVFSQAYGMGDVEGQESLKTDDLFHVASQTKMLTAIALMQQVESGKLKLDDKALAYLPWLEQCQDPRYQDITVRHLLSHSAGLVRDGADSDYWLGRKPCPTYQELKKDLISTSLVFNPGTELKYSNLGFALLGQIITVVSGQPYEKYVRQNILEPLKLCGPEGVILDYSAKTASRIVPGYGLRIKQKQPKVFVGRPRTQTLQAAIGLYASTRHMCRIAAALLSGNTTLISDASKQEMVRCQQTVATGYDQGLEFGLGLERQTIGKRQVVGHSGHMAGHMTATYFDPDKKVIVSIAGNAKDVPSTHIARGIFGAIDYFNENCSAGASYPASIFSLRFHNDLSTVEVVHTDGGIVAIDPDDWEPFAWYEQLERIDDTTLRLVTPGSAYNYGELVRYTITEDKVVSVRFAGLVMVPDADY